MIQPIKIKPNESLTTSKSPPTQWTLPTKLAPPTSVDPKVLILYGPPKVGKTTMLSKLPDNLIVDLEDGTDYISSMHLKAHNMSELEAIAQRLREEVVKT